MRRHPAHHPQLQRLWLSGLGAACLWIAAAVIGCASGDTGGFDAGGGGGMDGSSSRRDSGGPVDSGRGTVTCEEGQHLCGGGCVNDFVDNLPEDGCLYGCGEPCPAPDEGVASCSPEGECSWDCLAPFRREGEECVCNPTTSCELGGFECGAVDDGCGLILDCGSCSGTAVCQEGRCVCQPDAADAEGSGNNIRDNAVQIASLNDGTDEDREFGYSLHTDRDEDWFAVRVTDGGNIFNNPQLIVSLSNVPVGANYELSAYYLCDGGDDTSTCAAGDVDNRYGRGCSSTLAGMANESVTIDTECDHLSASEDGTLLIHIRSTEWALSCASYRLVVGIN